MEQGVSHPSLAISTSSSATPSQSTLESNDIILLRAGPRIGFTQRKMMSFRAAVRNQKSQLCQSLTHDCSFFHTHRHGCPPPCLCICMPTVTTTTKTRPILGTIFIITFFHPLLFRY
jgi:hypothetical protein